MIKWLKSIDYKVLYKHYSSQALIALAALGGAYEYIPELASYLPPKVITVIAVLGWIGKVINQGKKAENDAKD